MSTVKFKAKVLNVEHLDGVRTEVKIPHLTRKHCNMDYFRNNSPRFSGYANSTFFEGMLSAAVKEMAPCTSWGELRPLNINALPDGFTVDTSGFLAVVTIDLK
jgi:hypothetical protein